MAIIKRCCILSLVITAFLFSCSDSGIKNRCIDISGQWEIIPSDNNFKDPDMEEKAYSINLPGAWDNILNKNKDLTATVWIRKRVNIGEKFRGRLLVLSMGRIAVTDTAFFNGVKIGSEGRFPSKAKPLRYRFSLIKERSYFIPEKLVNYNGVNTISIRVFSHVISGIAGRLMITDYENWRENYRFEANLLTILNASTLIINFTLILFFFSILEEFKRRKQVLYVILIVIIESFGQILLFGFISMDGLLFYKIIFSLFIGGYFCFLMVVQEFFRIKVRHASIAALILFLITVCAIILSPNSNFLTGRTGYLLLIIVLAYIIYYTAIFIVALIRDPRRYWFFILMAIPLFITSFDIAYYITVKRIHAMPPLIMYHLPIVLIAVMFVLISDLKKFRSGHTTISRLLLKKTRKLNSAMKQLKKEGAKPEPREVIYGLIEYLDENFTESYNRKALALRFNLNEDYIGQIFKKTTGKSISKYIYTKRIDAARQLLEETDSKIIDIAYHVGFDNLTHFYRFFKKQTSVTPKEYRKSSKEQEE